MLLAKSQQEANALDLIMDKPKTVITQDAGTICLEGQGDLA